jgi:hypothetical protein
MEEALAAIDRAHAEVHALLAGISLDELEEPATIGGGEWSAKDLVGHLTTWEEIALTTVDEWRAGERPQIEETIAAGSTDQRNADEVARKSVEPAAEVLRRYDEVYALLGDKLRGISPGEWEQPATYEHPAGAERTLGALLGGILGSESGPFEHFLAHRRDLRAFSGPRAPG